MITSLLLVPIIGSFILIPMNENSTESRKKMKQIAITTSLINFIISIFLWVNFDSSSTQYQFVYEFNKLSFFDFNLGVDGISLYFVLLTTFVTPIALISNYANINKNVKYFLISFLLLETLQILTFVALDLLLFYIFFESVLPILFILIIVYGSGKNKTRSALLLFLYTLLGSLPMLLSILFINSVLGSTDFLLISLVDINFDTQKILWLGFFIAFCVKTPLWPLSRWLPLAHSDSPLAGSIILAGTILKLASYGMIRILLTFLPDATNYFSPMVQTIAVISIIYASLATIVQQDTKTLIAYSSIGHMGVLVLGIFSNTIQGIEGAILLGIGHGFVSPALFICVGGVIYDRTGTRLIKYIRGLVFYMPMFTILFFVFILANTGAPLTLNFLGEALSLMGIFKVNPIIAVLGGTGIVLSACYSIFLYNRMSYGTYSPHLKPLKDLSRREFVILISLLIPTVLLGIFPNIILDTLHVSVTQLLYNINITPFQNTDAEQEIISQMLIPLISHKSIPKYSQTAVHSKDIVVWGSNLSLTVGMPLYTRIIRNMITLPYFQYSVAIGLQLSDGWTVLSNTKSLTSSRNASLGFVQALAKFEYFMHVFNIFSHYCSKFPTLTMGKKNGTITARLNFITRALPCFTEIHKIFYIPHDAFSRMGKKRIPEDIFNLLDSIALAHWIMGDGAKAGKGLILCTDSFSLQDVVRLMNVLIIKYNLKCSIWTIKPGSYRLHISAKSMDKVREIVKPYFIDSMLYKINL